MRIDKSDTYSCLFQVMFFFMEGLNVLELNLSCLSDDNS